jgi:hypothetical protein
MTFWKEENKVEYYKDGGLEGTKCNGIVVYYNKCSDTMN